MFRSDAKSKSIRPMTKNTLQHGLSELFFGSGSTAEKRSSDLLAISITTLGETTCCCLNTRDLRIATQQMRVFATSILWTPSHMRASIRALYSFYLHLERGRSSRWERNCQRNSAADEKLFITSLAGEGVYNFRRGPDLGVNFKNPQNVIGVEILRHGTGIPCKCCQSIF